MFLHNTGNPDIVSLNKTSERAFNTNYTNNTGKAITVTITARCAITVLGGVATVEGKSDALETPTASVSGIVGIQTGLLSENNTFELSFVVKPRENYRIEKVETNGTVILGKWFENSLT